MVALLTVLGVIGNMTWLLLLIQIRRLRRLNRMNASHIRCRVCGALMLNVRRVKTHPASEMRRDMDWLAREQYNKATEQIGK